jgi:L(+)-tartrate dehydratase beta subunit
MRAIIGKSGMHPDVYRSFVKNKCVYLLVVGYGLLSGKYAKSVKEVKGVYWQKEAGGIAEAMWVMEMENFGPFIVECDTEGNSLYTLANREYVPKLTKLLEKYPAPWLKRHGEVQVPRDEVVIPRI